MMHKTGKKQNQTEKSLRSRTCRRRCEFNFVFVGCGFDVEVRGAKLAGMATQRAGSSSPSGLAVRLMPL
ncbi:hypothetical protein H5410_036686 [Solanum commersonii]|uniref:Uncharacterized protein n=1 Tax=Solanum commersonii TaxID=4109 RepID=A0A9J5Y8X4_SOLCO|nr:hypothetical protein H5410_036686 [Solanum commersonii]